MPANSVQSRKSRKRKKTVGFTPRQRTLLVDRLEEAIRAGHLSIDRKLYAETLAALFPEDFPRDSLPLDRPVESAPGSAGRIEDYARRRAGHKEIFNPNDLEAVRDDRLGLLIKVLRNGHVSVGGWESSR